MSNDARRIAAAILGLYRIHTPDQVGVWLIRHRTYLPDGHTPLQLLEAGSVDEFVAQCESTGRDRTETPSRGRS